MSIFSRAALLGVATGGRSTFGLVFIATTAPSTGSLLTSRWVKGAAVAAAVGEGIGDKLPQTPSRLQPQGLVARAALGALAGAILSQREGYSRSTSLLAGLLGAAGAMAGAQLGARWRALAADRFGPDWPGAVTEDAAALTAALLATRG